MAVVAAVVIACLAVAVFWSGGVGQTAAAQSSVTRDSITIEIVETAPAGLDNPNIRNTPDVWLELVENAHQTIDMEIYTIYKYSGGPIGNFHNAIYNAAARGVRVRMLIDNVIYNARDEDNHQHTKELMDAFDAENNIDVRQLSQPMHSKVIIVDNEAAYVGSANQSRTAMESNREIGLLIRGSSVVNALEVIFEAGWTGEENRPGAENWKTEWTYPVATPIEAPSWVPTTAETVIGLINSAKTTVHAFVYLYSGSPSALETAIENAAARGVNVQIIADNWTQIEWSSLEPLLSLTDYQNIQAKLEAPGEWSAAHAKMVVVDSRRAYIGSANWTNIAMSERREIGMYLEDPALAATLEEIFRTDWESRYAYWVKEPAGFPFLLAAGIVAVVVVLVVLIFWGRRGAKKKSQKRMFRAELWASGRHEV